jgi:mono/diheme cytochrome c family protein
MHGACAFPHQNDYYLCAIDHGAEGHRVRFLKTVLFLVIATAMGGLALMYAGIYDVSATRPHEPLVKRAVSITVERSVRRHARDIRAPNLEDSALLRMGGRHYREMCVICHGAPGVEPSEIGKGLYPKAPKLGRAAEEWNAAELFWITRNGIKMSGMPAFGPTHGEKELWAIVAFLEKLPSLDSAAYARLGDDHDDGTAEPDRHHHHH